MPDISETDIRELTRRLVAEVPPGDVDQFTFRGEQFDRGLALVQFPEGLGGLGLESRRLQTVVDEELRAAGVPYHDLSINPIGIGMGAPVVLTYASDEQKKRLLEELVKIQEVLRHCVDCAEMDRTVNQLELHLKTGGEKPSYVFGSMTLQRMVRDGKQRMSNPFLTDTRGNDEYSQLKTQIKELKAANGEGGDGAQRLPDEMDSNNASTKQDEPTDRQMRAKK